VQAWEPLDAALRRHVTELETVVMSMRLMTLRGLFSRMHQVVRAYAASHPEKEVQLSVSGDDIQVDKRVLDRLGEPFIHLVRNAIDHGVESIVDRVAAGKPRVGKLGIHAEATADKIVIRLSDDGRGIRPAKLLAKARERGLDTTGITDDESAIELIFRPGFSTADEITGVSGRGVGMDAVRSSITELGGTVGVETNPGHGTTFLVTLPVSVSIVPVVLLDVNGETYATHVAGVIEVCRIPAREIHGTSGEPMFRFHERFIRCLDLRARMHGGPPVGEEADASICVVRRGGALHGLRVTRVLATTEVVVKPLPALSPLRSYVHGVSILPTGQAIFVLSLSELADHLFIRPGGQALVAA
jgi:two-component system chemotaxis sensor kinase CheA